MMKNSLHKSLALLIDADNAQLSAIEQVLKLADYYGQVDFRRAYGDWKKLPLLPWREKLEVLNIEIQQVPRERKNATDNYLLLDVGELLGSNLFNDPPDVFVIVSGDGDFTTASEWIKERGKQVIGIGNKNHASLSLKESCDRFFALEDLESEFSKLEQRYPIPPNAMRDFFTPLIKAYHRLTKSYDWVPYSQLGAKLREVVPDFDSRFGKYRLSTWVRSFDQDFETDGEMVRRIDPAPEQTRLELLFRAYEKTRGPDGLAHLGQLGMVLHALDTDYESHFGSKQLSKWLKAYPNVFTITDPPVTF